MLINKLKEPITISNITRDPYYEEEYLFEKDHLTLTDQVTVFVGPNGYGKTTLVNMLKEALEKTEPFHSATMPMREVLREHLN